MNVRRITESMLYNINYLHCKVIDSTESLTIQGIILYCDEANYAQKSINPLHLKINVFYFGRKIGAFQDANDKFRGVEFRAVIIHSGGITCE